MLSHKAEVAQTSKKEGSAEDYRKSEPQKRKLGREQKKQPIKNVQRLPAGKTRANAHTHKNTHAHAHTHEREENLPPLLPNDQK